MDVKEVSTIVRAGFAGEKRLIKIAEDLNAAGLGRNDGGNWTDSDVSNFARKVLGLRRNKPYTRKKGKPNGHDPKPKAHSQGLLQDLEEVMTSNLSETLKKSLIMALVKSEVSGD